MGESAIKLVRTHRRRKHPYRRVVRIVLGVLFIISLIYVMLSLQNKSGSSVGPTAPSVSEENTSVQFK